MNDKSNFFKMTLAAIGLLALLLLFYLLTPLPEMILTALHRGVMPLFLSVAAAPAGRRRLTAL